MGVQGIKLRIVLDIFQFKRHEKEICSITTSGLVKRTQIKFIISNRATKGVKVHSLKDNEEVAG